MDHPTNIAESTNARNSWAEGFLLRAVAAAMLMLALLYVASFAVLWDKSSEMSALKTEITALADEQNALRAEIAAVRSPAILAERAEALGMTFVDGTLYYINE